MKKPVREATCALCGAKFRTRNPKRALCFSCLPPMSEGERKACRMLKK